MNKSGFTIITLIIVFLLSINMIYRYNYVEYKQKEDKVNQFQSEDYINNLMKTNYYLYYKNKSSQYKEIISPSNVFLTKETIESMINNVKVDYYSSKLEEKDIRDSFNYLFNTLGSFISSSSGNIKYSSMDLTNEFKIENYSFAGMNEEQINTFFRNFIAFDYDNNGRATISKIYGFDREHMNNYFMDIRANEKILSNYSFL